METFDFDVVVVGAGMAGAQAALSLRTLGLSALVLEARDQVGGRAMSRVTPGIDGVVEFGGAWVMPDLQPRIAAALARYGLGVVEGPAASSWAWRLSEGLREGEHPLDATEFRALARVLHGARRESALLERAVADGRLDVIDDHDVSIAEWIARWALPAAVEDILLAFVGNAANVVPAQGSIVGPLLGIADYGGDPWRGFKALNVQIREGTTALVESLLADSEQEVRVGCEVTRIADEGGRVRVVTRAGEEVTAGGVIVALPVNAVARVAFEPGLPPHLADLAGAGHPGRGFKVWAVVRGLSGFPFVLDAEGPIHKVRCQANDGEHALVVAIGNNLGPGGLEDRAFLESQLRRRLGDVEVCSIHAHDWVADPFSAGGWFTPQVGRASQLYRFLAAGPGDGRVRFAGSDLAVRWDGWLEGALRSGERAATDVAAVCGAR